MITINLKPGAKRAKAGSAMAGALGALKGLPGKIKDPWPMAAVVVWVGVVAFLGWVGIGSVTKLHRLDSELTAARSENRRFRVFAAERRRAEAARDSVIMQIATIRSVDGDRYVWAHILDEVTRALPQYTWLTDLSGSAQPPADSTVTSPSLVNVQIIGRAMDIQGLTRFMRQLEDSPWLQDVAVVSTETAIERGRAVTLFTLKTTYARPEPEARPSGGTSSAAGGM